MAGKGRMGPRERQTMSGMLGDRGDVAGAPVSSRPDLSPRPAPAPAESVIVDPQVGPLSVDPQALVQLSLWKRVYEAAEREFERDDTPAVAQDHQRPPNQRHPRDRDGR